MKTVEVSISSVSRCFLKFAADLSAECSAIYKWRKGDSRDALRDWRHKTHEVVKTEDDLDIRYGDEWRRELDAIGEARLAPFVLQGTEYASAHLAPIEVACLVAEAAFAALLMATTGRLPADYALPDVKDLPLLTSKDCAIVERGIEWEEASYLRRPGLPDIASEKAPIMPYKIISSTPLNGAVATMALIDRDQLHVIEYQPGAGLDLSVGLQVNAGQSQALTAKKSPNASWGAEATRPPIWSLGDRRYRVGAGEPFIVSDVDDTLLQAFADNTVMDEVQLIDHTGYSDAVKSLRRLCEKYNGWLAPAVRFPGTKSGGGYYADVRRPKGP